MIKIIKSNQPELYRGPVVLKPSKLQSRVWFRNPRVAIYITVHMDSQRHPLTTLVYGAESMHVNCNRKFNMKSVAAQECALMEQEEGTTFIIRNRNCLSSQLKSRASWRCCWKFDRKAIKFLQQAALHFRVSFFFLKWERLAWVHNIALY